MGMHAWEASIMRLWDAGASIEAIACNTGRSRDQVNRVVSRYADAGGERAHKAAMRRGSTDHGLGGFVGRIRLADWQSGKEIVLIALAHGDSNAVRGVYHRGKHWEERVRMAQWWSDYLDTIREGGKVIKGAFVGRA